MKKALYGLKQAPRAWYSRIDSYMLNKGFKHTNNEPTLYTKKNLQGEVLIACIYVDDLLYTGNLYLEEFRLDMEREFEMTNLGHMKYFLGLEIEQLEQGIFISQKNYAQDVLTKFRMNNCKPISMAIILGTKLRKNDEGVVVNFTLHK